MPVLDRSELEASPLADLHAIANELGVDGYRLLPREQLINAILGEPVDLTARELRPPAAEPADGARSSSTRGRRTSARRTTERRPAERSRSRGGTRTSASSQTAARAGVEGVVELRDNGSAFLRVHPPGPSDDDVYISPAQVKRCELSSGDSVAGPVRKPRRGERHPSLARVETINGEPADTSGATRGAGTRGQAPAEQAPAEQAPAEQAPAEQGPAAARLRRSPMRHRHRSRQSRSCSTRAMRPSRRSKSSPHSATARGP